MTRPSGHLTGAATSVPCPPENDIAEFALGGLADARRVRIEEHLDACAACRAAVADVASSRAEEVPSRSGAVGSSRPRLLQGGDRIGRYVIRGWLGQGAMGAVYRASDTVLLRDVALKVMAHRDGGRRWIREARAVVAIGHANIVSVYDVDQIDGTGVLAMELVTGRTLRQCLAEGGASLDTRLSWLVAVASALAAAHASGVVHRDVKPENVMVGDDGIVKVLDFGLARWLDDRTHAASEAITHEGTLVGTPAYMAPEQLRGEPADGRSDQFAWGVVAYELLAGRRPWETSGGGYALAAEILTHEPVGLRSLEPAVAAHVEAVVARAMSKSPGGRFPSMDALLEALSRPVAPPRRRRTVVATVVASIALASTVALSLRPGSASAPSAAATAASGSPARAMTLVDLPVPEPVKPEALAAYTEGMQALRGGGSGRAYDAFARAVAAEPSFAAAHLRAAQTAAAFAGFRQTRIEYQSAARLRSRLSERDQALLDALEPALLRSPADQAETHLRLRTAVDRYPDDAELSYLLGHSNLYDLASLTWLRRATEIDPQYADAWEAQGRTLAWNGKVEEALQAIDRCQQIPTALDCVYWRFVFDGASGDCTACEADARRRIDRDPLGQWGYRYLADAFAALGRPNDAIRAALEQVWSAWDDRSMSEQNRARERARDEADLAILAGDFASAAGSARRALELAEADAEGRRQAPSSRQLVRIALETGDEKEAASLADAFVKRAGVLMMTETGTFDRDASDLPWLAHVAYRHGKLTPADFEAERARWKKRWLAGSQPGWAWVVAYAAPADAAEEALDALARLDELGPLPAWFPTVTNAELPVATVYALAGRTREAEEHAQRAAKHCARFNDPFAHPHAELELGQIEETLGNKPAACDAYRAVLAQWGNARPRSVTADRARDRIRALACAR